MVVKVVRGRGRSQRHRLGFAVCGDWVVDHERQARSTENRLDSAWFGSSSQMKQKALEQALQLVA